MSRARELRGALAKVPGVTVPYAAPIFNEFVLRLPVAAADIRRELAQRGIVAGLPLSAYGGSASDILVCATELTTPPEIEKYAAELRKVLAHAVAAV